MSTKTLCFLVICHVAATMNTVSAQDSASTATTFLTKNAESLGKECAKELFATKKKLLDDGNVLSITCTIRGQFRGGRGGTEPFSLPDAIIPIGAANAVPSLDFLSKTFAQTGTSADDLPWQADLRDALDAAIIGIVTHSDLDPLASAKKNTPDSDREAVMQKTLDALLQTRGILGE